MDFDGSCSIDHLRNKRSEHFSLLKVDSLSRPMQHIFYVVKITQNVQFISPLLYINIKLLSLVKANLSNETQETTPALEYNVGKKVEKRLFQTLRTSNHLVFQWGVYRCMKDKNLKAPTQKTYSWRLLSKLSSYSCELAFYVRELRDVLWSFLKSHNMRLNRFEGFSRCRVP